MQTSVSVVMGRRRLLLRADPSMRPGREGTVYADPSDSDYVVKVMHAPDKPWREKLGVMLKHPLSAPDVAWPVRKVFSPDRHRLVGARLPFAARKWPILCVYASDPATRWIQADYGFRVRVAENLAAAMDRVHRHGCVVGDVSPSNILVGKDASVCLIDVDSMQITRAGFTYRCSVGAPEYTPPELHGTDFASVDRTVQHDAFGLACLIFQLLVGPGNHPFAARYIGTGNQLGVIQRIEQGIWAYAGVYPDYVVRTAAPLDLLHPVLQRLARASFLDGHTDPRLRPLPADWLSGLAEVNQDTDFLQNIAPQLENEARQKHAASVAASMRASYPTSQPVSSFRIGNANRPLWRNVRTAFTTRLSSFMHSRVRAKLATMAAGLVVIAIAGFAGFAARGRTELAPRRLGNRPLSTPSYYEDFTSNSTPTHSLRPGRAEPSLYNQIAHQYRPIEECPK